MAWTPIVTEGFDGTGSGWPAIFDVQALGGAVADRVNGEGRFTSPTWEPIGAIYNGAPLGDYRMQVDFRAAGLGGDYFIHFIHRAASLNPAWPVENLSGYAFRHLVGASTYSRVFTSYNATPTGTDLFSTGNLAGTGLVATTWYRVIIQSVGNVHNVWIWPRDDAMPGTPTVSNLTNGNWASGRPGLSFVTGAGTNRTLLFDNFQIQTWQEAPPEPSTVTVALKQGSTVLQQWDDIELDDNLADVLDTSISGTAISNINPQGSPLSVSILGTSQGGQSLRVADVLVEIPGVAGGEPDLYAGRSLTQSRSQASVSIHVVTLAGRSSSLTRSDVRIGIAEMQRLEGSTLTLTRSLAEVDATVRLAVRSGPVRWE